MSRSHHAPAIPGGPGRTRPTPSRVRTYVLIAIDEGADDFARPLGTIVAGTRTQARSAASALHADIPVADLRAIAAASAPAGYLARALARDGERLLGERSRGERSFGPRALGEQRLEDAA